MDRTRRIVALATGSTFRDILPDKTASKAERAAIDAGLDAALSRSRLSDLTLSRVQNALATLRAEGRSLQTLNHYRAALRSFVLWAQKDGRLRDDPLIGLEGFNVETDRRHDRRTLSLDELRRLVAVAHRGPDFREMTGPMRALCYRLAVSSGLRYAEIASTTPESFDLGVNPSVTVRAGYTKNGQPATLPIPPDVASDLRTFLPSRRSGQPAFPLPKGLGAEMLRSDLERAGIPYRDDAGRVIDFHALRCQCATLADQAGASPRVVQRLMRHSSFDMTNRYTRPRMLDLEGATNALPALSSDDPVETLKATGTDGNHIGNHVAHYLPTDGDESGRIMTDADVTVQGRELVLMRRKPLELQCFDDSGCDLTCSESSDRGGARTLDQRINVPLRLSPTRGRGRERVSIRVRLQVWTIPSPSQARRV
ncbi:MAG: tyrosine-type recombinase/integrase [Planctomycetota bacterium]|nr:tyrosine-type recombinase/integrase [Planctomycetota bacterium]